MSIVVFVIMPGRVHGFLRKLRIRKEEVRISAVATVLGLGRSLELFVGELKRCDGVLPE